VTVGPEVADKKNGREKPVNLTPSLGDEFLQRFFKQPKKITVRTWIIGVDKEVMIDETEVKLGALDFTIGGFKYSIVYDAIQNVKGTLIYNTKHRVANGALRYRTHLDKEVDAKIRNDMSARDNLTAIWSRWQLPLIIALVAVVGCIVLGSILAVIAGSYANADSCLHSESCMVGKITQLKAQAEAEKAKQQAKEAQIR
jgi:hypothetical protein